MFGFINTFITAVRKDPEVFLIGWLTINIIPASIFLHYVLNHDVASILFLLLAYGCTCVIAAGSFPDFINVKETDRLGLSHAACVILHAVRMGCLAYAIFISPTHNLSILFVIIAFFVVFDVFLIRFRLQHALLILILNAAVVALVYPRSYPFLVFLTVVFAQVVVYLVHRTFKRIVRQQQELIQLNTQIDEISTESERLRMRHDLHDSLGHELTALSIEVALLESDSAHDHEKLSAMKSRVKHINRVIREIIENRHINVDMSVQDIIHQQIARVPRLAVRTELPSTPIILASGKQKLVVSGVLELLTNALKYSHSQDVNLTMTDDAEQLVLCIENDIEQQAHNLIAPTHSSSMGLQLLRERLHSMAGSLETDQQNHIFRVTLTLPIH